MLDLISPFNSADRREAPVRCATSLFFDASNGTVISPVNVGVPLDLVFLDRFDWLLNGHDSFSIRVLFATTHHFPFFIEQIGILVDRKSGSRIILFIVILDSLEDRLELGVASYKLRTCSISLAVLRDEINELIITACKRVSEELRRRGSNQSLFEHIYIYYI